MKQSYHTDLKIQYKWGLLLKETYNNIPRSTLYTWKYKDYSKLVGGEILFTDEKLELIRTFLSNKTLLKAAKGLFFVYSTWISITKNVHGLKTIMRKNMETVVKTIKT